MELATGASPRVAVRLFGPLTVRGEAGEIGAEHLPGVKPRQILECLALHHGSSVSKARLVSLLWPDQAPGEALPTLESYVSVLRQRLRAATPDKDAVIRTVPGGYVVDRRSVWVDVTEMRDLADRASRTDGRTRAALLEQAVRLGDRPLLADEPEAEWAQQERVAHARRWTQLCVEAAGVMVGLGDAAAALRLVDRALLADPLCERAWATKVRALESAGFESEALRTFMECRALFAEQLGCAPGNELQGLFWGLLHGASERADRWGDVVTAILRLQDELDRREVVGRSHTSLGEVDRACRVLMDLVRRAQVSAVPSAV